MIAVTSKISGAWVFLQPVFAPFCV